MSSKTDMLARIRQHTLEPTALPDLDEAWITYEDPLRHFCQVLESVGGRVLQASDPAEAQSLIQQLPPCEQARKIVSTVSGIEVGSVETGSLATSNAATSNIELSQVEDPHQLADIDLAILPAEFAVAENGAVWVTDQHLRHRVIYFIAQHLVLVLPASQVVQNMHEAYQRLEFNKAGYGLFISGPSKTADIEQSLVIGAHGPRSLTVVLLG